MKTIQVEVLSEATNAVVLQTPGRRFPGIVIQGDSLNSLVAAAKRICAALGAGRRDEALDQAGELHERLVEYQVAYEDGLRRASLELPYPK